MNGDLNDVEKLFEFEELAEDIIDELWNVLDKPYPQKRMKQLILAISNMKMNFKFFFR